MSLYYEFILKHEFLLLCTFALGLEPVGPVLRLAVPGAAVAAILEEGAQEGGGFGFEEAAFGGEDVVEAGVGGEVVEGAGGPGFGVGGGVDEAAYPGGVEGAGAHRAGLEGGVEGAAGEAPAVESFGGPAEG